MTDLRAFEYRHDELILGGELALPDGPGPHPGVLVMHNAHGVGAQVRERARRLAGCGYAALVTDMYGGGRNFPTPAEAGPPFAALQNDPSRLRARVVAAFDSLAAHPQVDAERVGAVGFCFGGQCVLELARSGAPARAVVSFHGLLHTHAPAARGEVKAKVLVLAGARDPYAPPEQVEALRQEFAAAEADWQLTVYGEGWHAFSDPDAHLKATPGVRYDPLLDRLSWAQAMAFLDEALKA